MPQQRVCPIIVSTVILLTGCSGSTEPVAELARAQARWAAHGPASYRITIFRGCECLPEVSGPAVVVVRDGQVESRRYAPEGDPVPAGHEDFFPTVDGLFALIVETMNRPPTHLDLTFDPILGYPVRIEADFDGRWGNDDELLLRTSAFESLTDPALDFAVLGHDHMPAELTVRRVGEEIRVLGSLASPCRPYDAAGNAYGTDDGVVLEVRGRASQDCPQDVVSPLGYQAVLRGVRSGATLTIIHGYADANWPDTTVFHGVPEPTS